MLKKCIGLFGTCGESTWRNSFIDRYTQLLIPYYNPQVENWTPECATEEAQHLANDNIILFPITYETYGLGSLAETGFSILQAINLDQLRDFVVMIDPKVSDKLMEENPILAKESIRARALIYEHLKKLRLANLFVVENLQQMLEISIDLYEINRIKLRYQYLYNPHRRF